MEYSKKRRGHSGQNKKVARMDWMTTLVSADSGDASVAIVDAHPGVSGW
jgi:hypothetical protein